MIKITANMKKRRWWACHWIPRQQLMEVSQRVLREFHREDDESLYFIKYYIKKKYYLEINKMFLLQSR
jgi:hypothetical protein